MLKQMVETPDNTVKIKRNRVGLVSDNPVLVDVIGGELGRNDFNVTTLSLEDLADEIEPQNFYFVDMSSGFYDYPSIAQKIQAVRERSPDSELVLLQPPSVSSSPQASPLRSSIDRHLVPTYELPDPEESMNYQTTAMDDLATELSDHILTFLSQPNMVKVGGSIWDLYRNNPGILLELLGEVKSLHEQGYPIVLTTGGGPRLEEANRISETLGVSDNGSTGILESQARNIEELLSGVGEYISPENMKNIKRKLSPSYLRDRIPILTLNGLSPIPEKESDSHTLGIAERLGIYKVVFAKDTDGVYQRDPYRQPRSERGRFVGPISLPVVADNPLIPFIYASKILDGEISRVDSEGTGDHLIETKALLYLRDSTRHLRTIQIINGTKPELLRPALDGQFIDGKFVGSYVLKG